jgi:hypothetical protein
MMTPRKKYPRWGRHSLVMQCDEHTSENREQHKLPCRDHPRQRQDSCADFREEQPNGNKTKGISRIENPNMVPG